MPNDGRSTSRAFLDHTTNRYPPSHSTSPMQLNQLVNYFNSINICFKSMRDHLIINQILVKRRWKDSQRLLLINFNTDKFAHNTHSVLLPT